MTGDSGRGDGGFSFRAERAGRRIRRRRIIIVLSVVAAVGAAALVGVVVLGGAPGSRLRAGGRTAPTTATEPSAGPSASSDEQVAWRAFARADGLVLMVPVLEPTAVAFHQAYYGDALDMHPLGSVERNANRTEFQAPSPTPGPTYIVQSSRGRGTGPTTAVDIVIPKQSMVTAPVDGTIVAAKRYKLYGQYPDWRVEIRPTDRPDLRVIIIHLDEVQVRRGDEVSATLSPIGRPRVLPFHSAVNDYVPGGDPHVHIEVKNQAKA
ncbi:MAG: M23 family metallopeptidase [Actinomycetota bacterium]